MPETPLTQLSARGQSVWIDFLSRTFVQDGDLEALAREGVNGVTSNPVRAGALVRGGCCAWTCTRPTSTARATCSRSSRCSPARHAARRSPTTTSAEPFVALWATTMRSVSRVGFRRPEQRTNLSLSYPEGRDSVAPDGLPSTTRRGRGVSRAVPPRPTLTPRGAGSQANSISASQARAARRRAARRDEQAVAAWLRELAGRTR